MQSAEGLETQPSSRASPERLGSIYKSAMAWLSARSLESFRAGWLLVVVSTVVLFAIAFPVRAAELSLMMANLTPAQVSILREVGVSIDTHARLLVGVELAVALIHLMLALLIVWRRPRDPVAFFMSATLLTYAAWTDPPLDTLAATASFWAVPATAVQAIGWLFSQVFYFTFPTGRFVPRWTRWLAVVCAVWAVIWILVPESPLNLGNPFKMPLGVFVLTLTPWFASIGAQVYRWLRVATPIERQQTKLVVFAIVTGVVGYLAFAFDRFAYPVLDQPTRAAVIYDLIGVPIFIALSVVVPIAFAISILRYRLWQTEQFIGRAIVYGALTAVLAGLYSASITLFQRVFIALTGTASDAAIVMTTLVLASAFTPVKSSLQTVVDRYLKEPPDPTAKLRAFQGQVRNLVEMIDSEQITRRALDEAVDAFGADCGAVYLYAHQQPRLSYACGEWNQVEGMTALLECDGARYGWITLGPRKNGEDYGDADREVFTETTTLVARSIHFTCGWGAELGRLNAQLALPWDTYRRAKP